MDDERYPSYAQERLFRILRWLDGFVLATPLFWLGLVLGFLALLKTGLVVPGLVTIWDPATWPQPVDTYPHMSYGLRSAGWLLGATSFADYFAISAAAVLMALALIIVVLTRSSPPHVNRLVILLVLGGPLAWALFGTFGRPDPLTITGGILLGALGRKWYWAIAGVSLAVLGNADQAVVFSLGLFLASWAQPLSQWRWPSLLAFGVSSVASASLTLWGELSGVPTRGGLLDAFWKQSIQQFMAAAPVQIYAAYGITIFVLIWALLDGRLRTAIPILLGVLILPAVFTAITLDQTRVFIGCSSAAIVACVVRWGPSIEEFLDAKLQHPWAVTSLAVVFLPAIEITGDIVRVPWLSYVPLVQSYLVAPLTGSG